MSDRVELRAVEEDDLAIFFEFENDRIAVQMAAFTPEDPSDHEAFRKQWNRILTSPTVRVRTILLRDETAGSILSYEEEPGKPEVTYWTGRQFWGKGITTEALRQFLETVDQRRPMKARTAADNTASLRVLEKCGFIVTGEARGFANARQAEIDELVLELI